MKFILFPLDYEQLPEPERKAIVPICISSVDRHGNPIDRMWIEEGVAPIQDHLRKIARNQLKDVRRVSELTEIVVHKLWERHGADAGILPWRRVFIWAMWEAQKLAAGDWYSRHTEPLGLDTFQGEVQEDSVRDPTDYGKRYEQSLMIDVIERRIDEQERDDLRQYLKMLRAGFTWEEIGDELGYQTSEAPRKRFERWIKKNFPKGAL
jgi:hypothetical protein